MKYATTGDLPPNSKGGAFLHDPKMSGEKEVKAHVKLAFANASGVNMICTRAMLLSLKRTTSTFKTLEGQLLAINKGERTTLSTKCAELDVQVPTYLGVSKSILDYVIFCHQDESLWPLAEPSLLKKRFDEIFEALKFTKALDSIKVIRKDMAIETKLLEQSTKHLKQDKERADRIKERMKSNDAAIEAYKEGTVLLEEKLERITRESDNLFKSNQEFQRVLSKLDNFKHAQRSLNDQINRLEDSTTLLPNSDEDLQYKLSNFQANVRNGQERVEKLKNKVADKQASLRTLRQEYDQLISQEGELKGKQREYHANLERRSRLITIAIEELELNVSSDDYAGFYSEIEHLLSRNEKLLMDLQTNTQKEEFEVDKKLKLVSDSKIKESQHREYGLKDIKSIESENKALASKMSNLDINEGGLEYERLKLEDLENKLHEIRDGKAVENIIKEIRGKNFEIATLESEFETRNQEISQAHRQADAHAKISLLNDEKSYREKALSKLISTNRESFEAEGLELENLETNFKTKVSELQAAVYDFQQKADKMKDHVYTYESDHRFKSTTIDNLTKELESAEKKFKDELEDEEVDDYDEILTLAENDYKIALENLKMNNTTLQFNKKALAIAENEHSCYLCSRKFDDSSILSIFIKELKIKTEGGLEKQLQEQLESQKEYLDTVRSLAPSVDRIVTTNKKLFELDEYMKINTPQLEEQKRKLDIQLKELDHIKDKLAKLEDLKAAVTDITRMRRDLDNVSTQLAEKQKELNDYGSTPKSLEALQEEQSVKSAELKTLRKQVNNLLENKDNKQRELSILEGDVKDKRLKISNIERSLVEKENLLKSIEENKNKISKLGEMVDKSNGIIQELEDEIRALSDELSKLKERNKGQIEQQEKNVKQLKVYEAEFSELANNINNYVNQIESQLSKCQEELNLIRTLITENEEDIEQLSLKVSEEEIKLADTNSEERNLKNNLDIRRMQNDLKNIERDISEMNVQNAESERDKYEEQSRRLREQYSTLNAQLAGKMGEIKQMEDQSRQFQKELDTEFENVEKAYQEEWVKLNTKTIALDDLATYSRALDSAIMKYHSMKMQEINRIIDELWKVTYSGTDVDTIMIKSDQNTASKGNRTYNYRVVMVKQDAELDMRGRCSAGQKVLASIIIRLALAECFGVNCGMIALDEPTTNLDAENIESLARSLSNIIELRQAQKNFQLIVITHDEKFLTYMNASKYTDHFYKVKRNDMQKSQIEWVNISRVSVE